MTNVTSASLADEETLTVELRKTKRGRVPSLFLPFVPAVVKICFRWEVRNCFLFCVYQRSKDRNGEATYGLLCRITGLQSGVKRLQTRLFGAFRFSWTIFISVHECITRAVISPASDFAVAHHSTFLTVLESKSGLTCFPGPASSAQHYNDQLSRSRTCVVLREFFFCRLPQSQCHFLASLHPLPVNAFVTIRILIHLF